MIERREPALVFASSRVGASDNGREECKVGWTKRGGEELTVEGSSVEKDSGGAIQAFPAHLTFSSKLSVVIICHRVRSNENSLRA